ncbi:GNAT family N-acetyltransferase [Lichenibacterium dinghuense]|uniref:GNAT family N-acetyltransferase n=1 Tax=Lichenibacterium dinghuense TaxID=2895977 RepID=UPI001F01FB97|nr:GNAT family N-acetyltransferase [Lichenibacterium sp. 6Y81]
MAAFAWRSFEDLSARDLHDVLKLRADVFVVEQACLFAEIDGRDPDALHLLARTAEGGPLAGTLRLFPPDAAGRAVIGRVATSAAARGTGFGRALMAEGVAEARRRYGPAPVAIGAQARLERFYAGFGFVRRGEDYVEDGIAHCAMLLG